MSNNKYKILLIEDEQNIQSLIEAILTTNGYQVVLSENCQTGMRLFSSHQPDLVILDLGLPDMDGLEFLKFARQEHTTPILVLSARTNEIDKVTSLDMGANDYVTKPFGTAELLARVRAALRTSRQNSAAQIPGAKFVLQDLTIDYDKRIVSVSGEDIHLTQTEFNILAFLSEHAGKVLTYSTIIRSIWGATDSGSIKKLQVNMANIRKKCGTKPGDNRYIINELGVGYRMRTDDELI
ncbi:MAG: response regulator transcription factor [Ruminococcaceae bacterium]|nr:response regulator transcription factor [Oscillospiraceae bacterium]